MNTTPATQPLYTIPLKFRRTENLHIIFWLIKDISWAMLWRPLGIAMLIPTLAVAVVITWQTRKIVSELFHNLAVVFWITANGFWMIIEFFGYDEQLRIYTSIPFGIGLCFIIAYYGFILPRSKRKQENQGVAATDLSQITQK